MHIIIFEHFLHVVAEPKFVKSYMHNYLFSGQKILAGWRNFCGMNLFLTSTWETALNKYAQKTLKYIGWQNNFHSSNYHLISNFFLHIKVFEAKKDTIYLKKTNLYFCNVHSSWGADRVYLIMNTFIDIFLYLPMILSLYLECLLCVYFYFILYVTWQYNQVV